MKSGSMISLLLVSLTLSFTACNRERPAPPPTPASEHPVEAKLRKMHILTADGKVAVTLRWGTDEVQVFFQEDGKRRFLRSRLGKGRQRRWNERGVGPVALVRTNPKGNAFTVRPADGDEIWWRVRLGDRAAVVRDHPELPGFDIRQRRDNGIRVTSGDKTELGEVLILAKSNHVQVFDSEGDVVYKTARNAPVSMLYGVLLAPGLEPVQRYILMAELLVR